MRRRADSAWAAAGAGAGASPAARTAFRLARVVQSPSTDGRSSGGLSPCHGVQTGSREREQP